MWMDKFVKKLYDFMGIYRNFLELKYPLDYQKTIVINSNR